MAIRTSKILTFYGYKNIEDISIDDTLLQSNGTFETREKSYTFLKTSLVHLKTYSHPEAITIIPEQLFYVRKKKRSWNLKYKSFDYSFSKPFWISAKDITREHYVGMIINKLSISIPEFETYDWYVIGKNFSHYSMLHEWLHNAPIHFIKKFIDGFDNKSPMTYYLALGIQRLYLKAGILSEIVRNSDNRYIVLRCEYSSFIDDGYAWYCLQEIKKTKDANVGIYEIPDTFILNNIVCLSKI
jgi:hypothetical protein